MTQENNILIKQYQVPLLETLVEKLKEITGKTRSREAIQIALSDYVKINESKKEVGGK